jgi:hypothetical protein
MKFLITVTSSGTYFCYTALFQPLRLKIGRSARPVDDIERLETHESYSFTIFRRRTRGAIVINFVPSRGLATNLMCRI